ncbi:MAG: hypothetical protein MUC48_17100 [Leptolyngbya sp. Prado105]|jgi:hypothetical protein|nr:hypothetical protein [Leptolyngbya sp. Prado105]
MTLQEQIQQQRVKHIVSSYQLDSENIDLCQTCLSELFELYPTALIELALVEMLVQNWAQVPMPRGIEFFHQVQTLLTNWQSNEIAISFSSTEFQLITGLDATPIFGVPPTPSIVQR